MTSHGEWVERSRKEIPSAQFIQRSASIGLSPSAYVARPAAVR